MSIFDGNTRAGMTSYQAAMSKGMPPDQAEAYTHGLDVLGILDYTNLPAVLRQFQQLKQPPAQQQPTPNVAQQLQMMAQAKQGGGLGAIRPDAMPPGQTAYAPPAMNPMAQGLGGMNAGAMENPSFAGGGIVAFQQGGGAQTQPIRAANLPRSDEEMFNYFYSLAGEGGEAAYRKAKELREKQEREAGVGEFAKSLQEEEALLGTEELEAAGQTAEDIRDLRRQEAADIAGAASGSRSLLEAMSKARSKAVERERDLTAKTREATAARNRARIALTKAKETAKATGLASDRAAVEKAEANLIATERRLQDTKNRKQEAVEQLNREIKLKQTVGAGTAPDAMEQIRLKMVNTPRTLPDGKPNPAYEDLEDQLQAMRGSLSRMLPEDRQAIASAERELAAAKKKAVDLAGNPIPNSPEVLAAQEKLYRVMSGIAARGINVPGFVPRQTAPAAPTAAGAPASGNVADVSDDFIRRELGI